MKKSKKILIFFSIAILSFTFSRCIYYDYTVNKVNWEKGSQESVNNYIIDVNSDGKMFKYNLCESLAIEWDSIAVIRPYIDKETIGNLDLPFFSRVGRIVSLQSIDDSNYTLLFRINGKYTGYSVVPYGHLDFSTYRNNKDEIVTWIRKKDCNKVSINKEEHDNYTIYHVIKQ